MVSWGGEDDYEFSFEPETKRNEEIKKKVLTIIDRLLFQSYL